jgi:cobalt-zinc-cadmium efflux system protein
LQRIEVLAALTNGLLLVGVAVWVLIQAVERWNQPADISSGLMLWVAVLGGAANLAGLLILRRGQRESLNLRGAYLEVLGDHLLGSVAVIIAAIVISLTGYTRADSIASLAIFVLIIPRASSLLREVVDVLLEATPRGV